MIWWGQLQTCLAFIKNQGVLKSRCKQFEPAQDGSSYTIEVPLVIITWCIWPVHSHLTAEANYTDRFLRHTKVHATFDNLHKHKPDSRYVDYSCQMNLPSWDIIHWVSFFKIYTLLASRITNDKAFHNQRFIIIEDYFWRLTKDYTVHNKSSDMSQLKLMFKNVSLFPSWSRFLRN